MLAADSADAALRLFEANDDIRLLFTDVSMPGTLNGSELARRVAERWPSVRIIMTSGRPFPVDLPDNERFHAKPYLPEDVLRDAKEMAQPLA